MVHFCLGRNAQRILIPGVHQYLPFVHAQLWCQTLPLISPNANKWCTRFKFARYTGFTEIEVAPAYTIEPHKSHSRSIDVKLALTESVQRTLMRSLIVLVCTATEFNGICHQHSRGGSRQVSRCSDRARNSKHRDPNGFQQYEQREEVHG